MNKLFESNTKATAIPYAPNAEIIWHSIPYIQYDQIKLDDNFRQYPDKAIISEVLKTGIKKTPYQKSFKVNTGMQDCGVNFRGANRQFSFLKVSLVYDKSNPHKTIYNSYNIELASNRCSVATLKMYANN